MSTESSAWDAFAYNYLERVFCVLQFAEKRRRILQEVRPGRVLDIGCGPTGFLLSDLSARGDVRPVGTDISSSMLLAARAAAPGNVRLVRADNRALPFRDGMFKTAFVINSILAEERNDVARMVSEAVRVLVGGGRLVAVFPAFEMSLIARAHWPMELRIDEDGHREYDTTGWQCFQTTGDLRDLMIGLRVSNYAVERLLFVEPAERAVIRHVYSEALSDQVLTEYPLFEHLLVAEKS